MNPLKILFIGSNPSVKALSNAAFTPDTASGRLLQTWTMGIQGMFYYENISSQKTENNRPLNRNEMALASVSLLERIKEINPDRIVTLGKCATNVLINLKLDHFEMPHPSGRNRKLNNRLYTQRMVQCMHTYIKEEEICGNQNILAIKTQEEQK